MSATELVADTIIFGERNYEAALDLIIAEASDDLLIFDQDFLKGGYASQNRVELIINHCPKLFEMLRLYGHKMTVYETNDAAKVAKDCFVIADKKHYLRRFHIDQARFKFAFNDEEMAANLLMRFDELLEETANIVSVTQLGL
jgi:hypothetical protein